MSAMTGTHRYPQNYVASVNASDARDYLAETGLPEESAIFAPAEGGERFVDGRYLLELSDTENGGTYFVDRESGEIVLYDEDMANLVPVNASPRQFGECIAAFEEATADSSLSEAEEIAARLRVELAGIDPTALQDDHGFWQSLLNDVLIGDYADDEDEDDDE